MDMFSFIQEVFLGYNSFFYLRNIIEVVFFSLLFYYFSLWLKKDQQKNLLPCFYGYCLITLAAHFIQLTTISYFLLLFAPVTLMLFILLHQELLQKNFVAFKNIKPAQQLPIEWVEILIRSCLIAINNNKEIRCVIEQQDKLDDFVYADFFVHANLNQQLLKILQESEPFEQQKMIWINTHGIIVAMNASLKNKINKILINEACKKLDSWKQQVLLLSSKTDALFFSITPTKRTFEIIFNGKIIDNINATNALNIIRKYASTDFWTKKPTLKKGELFEYIKKDNLTEHTN